MSHSGWIWENVSYNESAISEKQAGEKIFSMLILGRRGVVCTFLNGNLFNHPLSKDLQDTKFGICIRDVLGIISGKIHWNLTVVSLFKIFPCVLPELNQHYHFTSLKVYVTCCALLSLFVLASTWRYRPRGATENAVHRSCWGEARLPCNTCNAPGITLVFSLLFSFACWAQTPRKSQLVPWKLGETAIRDGIGED